VLLVGRQVGWVDLAVQHDAVADGLAGKRAAGGDLGGGALDHAAGEGGLPVQVAGGEAGGFGPRGDFGCPLVSDFSTISTPPIVPVSRASTSTLPPRSGNARAAAMSAFSPTITNFAPAVTASTGV
jgi:hypothetical protein